MAALAEIIPHLLKAFDNHFSWLHNFLLCVTECLLENIGKPVFHNYSPSDLYGSWMQDAVDVEAAERGRAVSGAGGSSSAGNNDKIWMTTSTDNMTLYEYTNKMMYKKRTPSRNYTLPLPFAVSFVLKTRGVGEN